MTNGTTCQNRNFVFVVLYFSRIDRAPEETACTEHSWPLSVAREAERGEAWDEFITGANPAEAQMLSV